MSDIHHRGDDVVVEAFGQLCSAVVLDEEGPQHTVRLRDGNFAGTELALHDMYLHRPRGRARGTARPSWLREGTIG